MINRPVQEGIIAVGAVLVGCDRLVNGSMAIGSGRVLELGIDAVGEGSHAFAIPGLRNAHAHLDLSLITDMIPAAGGFCPWVLELLARRVSFDDDLFRAAAARGAAELLASGTTAVVDIDSSGAAACAVAASGLKGVGCLESLGSGGGASQERAAKRWLEQFKARQTASGFTTGLSPHAPYSTSGELYQRLHRLGTRRRLLLTTHGAETRAEGEFLATGRGELKHLLDVLGASSPFQSPPEVSPIRYLRALGVLDSRMLLAHANYPQESDVSLLARSGSTVAFCPRSHAFFDHAPHPVRRYLAKGIRVALGTDSRASNSSLSMLDEMAFLRAHRVDLKPEEIFFMATAAAAPLLDGGCGRLDPGEWADLAIVESPRGLPGSLDQALDLVTTGAVTVLATLVSGKGCHVSKALPKGLLPLTCPGSGLFSALSGSDSREPPRASAGD